MLLRCPPTCDGPPGPPARAPPAAAALPQPGVGGAWRLPWMTLCLQSNKPDSRHLVLESVWTYTALLAEGRGTATLPNAGGSRGGRTQHTQHTRAHTSHTHTYTLHITCTRHARLCITHIYTQHTCMHTCTHHTQHTRAHIYTSHRHNAHIRTTDTYALHNEHTTHKYIRYTVTCTQHTRLHTCTHTHAHRAHNVRACTHAHSHAVLRLTLPVAVPTVPPEPAPVFPRTVLSQSAFTIFLGLIRVVLLFF